MGSVLSRSELGPFLHIWYHTVRTQSGLRPRVFNKTIVRRGWAVGKSVRFASGRVGVRIPATTDPICKDSDSSTAKRSAIGVSVTGPRR